MFYRRKVLIALLEAIGSPAPTKTDLQKHLFLLTARQEDPSYDFVPHRYGCFSFSADADLEPMIRQGLLSVGAQVERVGERRFASALREPDILALRQHRVRFGGLRGRELIRCVYEKHPYYSTRSVIADEVLGTAAAKQVRLDHAPSTDPMLMTIGYEGVSAEAYLNKLIRNGVQILVDVRRNPISRKYGFSKGRLSELVGKCGMDYVHYPSLGIDSSRRANLGDAASYAKLFEEYRKNLPTRATELAEIADLVARDGKRVALTCFEQDHKSCHRDSVANAITKLDGWRRQLQHL
jgi:uncharacterized protein DUF488